MADYAALQQCLRTNFHLVRIGMCDIDEKNVRTHLSSELMSFKSFFISSSSKEDNITFCPCPIYRYTLRAPYSSCYIRTTANVYMNWKWRKCMRLQNRFRLFIRAPYEARNLKSFDSVELDGRFVILRSFFVRIPFLRCDHRLSFGCVHD